MTTVNTIVSDALIDLGRLSPADTINASDLAHGIRVINRLIGRYATRNLMIPYTTSENFDGSGLAYYTMGTAGTASSARAIRIMSAFVNDSASAATPIKILGQEEYNNIYDKTTTGQPHSLFYDNLYPIGYIWLYPVPSASYTIYIESVKYLHAALSDGNTVSLSVEYEDFLVLALRNRLAGSYGIPVTGDMLMELMNAERDIKLLNSSNQTNIMDMPVGFGSTGNTGTFESG